MDETEALDCLSALAQRTRLDAFRLLIAEAPEGLAAGDIARRANVPQNTMSAHLSTLAQCGLVAGERSSRSIVYRAELKTFRALMTFLLADCCGGRAEVCAPILSEFASCCAPIKKQRETPRG